MDPAISSSPMPNTGPASANVGVPYTPDLNEDYVPGRMDTRHSVAPGQPLGPGQNIAQALGIGGGDPGSVSFWNNMVGNTGGGRAGAAAGDRLYSDDFFPTRGAGTQRGQTTRIGRYGGSPIFVGSPGVMPFAVLADRRRALQQQQAQAEQQAKGLAERLKVQDPKEAEYVAPYRQYAQAEMDSMIQSRAAMLAGGEDRVKPKHVRRAWREASGGDSEFSRMFRSKMDELDAKRLMIDDNTEQAQAMLKEIQDNERGIDAPPEMIEDLIDLVERQGEYATMPIDEFAKTSGRVIGQFNAFKDLKDQVDMTIKSKGFTDYDIQRIREGRWVGIGIEEQQSYETQREALRNQMVKKYGSEGTKWFTDDRIDQMIDTMLPPISKTLKVDEASQPSTGSSGAGNPVSEALSAVDVGGVQLTDRDGKMIKGAGGVNKDDQFVQIHLRNKTTTGRVSYLTPTTLNRQDPQKGEAERLSVIPTDILIAENGARYVYGFETKQPYAGRVRFNKSTGLMEVLNTLGEVEDSFSPDDQGAYFDYLDPVIVPYEQNKGVIQQATGITEADVNAKRDEYAQKESSAGPISPEEFNKKWASLKPGDTLVGPDGKTYKKK